MLIVFTVYVPTNRGLKFVREEGLKEIYRKVEKLRKRRRLDIQECRAEDIPEKIYNAREVAENQTVLGVTGQDLMREFIEDKVYLFPWGPDIPYRTLGLLNKGVYEKSIFGLPALCLLGKGGMTFDDFSKAFGSDCRDMSYSYRDKPPYERLEKLPDLRGKRVVIPQRYEWLIRKLLDYTAIGAELIPLDGKVDVTAATDDSIDYAVDIVLTGKTCKENGLGIFELLYRSDGVLLSNW